MGISQAVQDLVTRLDGWKNVLTGVGTSRDKRMGDSFAFVRLEQEQAEELIAGDDLAGKIVEKIPFEMTRRGWEIKIQAEKGSDGEAAKEIAEATQARLEELGAKKLFREALGYKRGFGGGALFVGADDGERDLTRPLHLHRIRSVRFLNALTPRELTPASWYQDPRAPKFGTPATYRLQSIGGLSAPAHMEVHESRLLIFQGIVVSRRKLRENQGWGYSVLDRCHRIVSDYQMSWASASALIRDFAQAVFKIKGLARLLATDQDAAVVKRLQYLDLSRSILRAAALDEGEEFERKTTPVTGLAELLIQMTLRVAAAADMPVTLLFGRSPEGLNATGASDIRFFYDTVAGLQEDDLRGPLERLIRLILLAKDGPTRGREPENWSVGFRSLWQPTEGEEAEIRNKQADTDTKYIKAGVLLPDEVASSRFGGDAYSTETVLDIEERKKRAEEAAKAQAALRDGPEEEPEEETQEEEEAKPEAIPGQAAPAFDRADAAPSNGVMLALYPPPDVARALVVPGGEPAEELHLTLCYLGRLSELEAGTLERTREVAEAYVQGRAPLSGEISGLGRFAASSTSDDFDILWAGADVPELSSFREGLVSALEEAGVSPVRVHGFTPHLTLAYLLPEDEAPIQRLGARPVVFGALSLVAGGERVDFPLGVTEEREA